MLADAVDAVLARKHEVETAPSFDELLQIVRECAPRGYGELTVYDAAVRLGARLGLEPDRIHLHSGTLDGARHLLGNQLGKRRVLERDELPAELHGLSPGHIENFLCIYKDRIPASE